MNLSVTFTLLQYALNVMFCRNMTVKMSMTAFMNVGNMTENGYALMYLDGLCLIPVSGTSV